MTPASDTQPIPPLARPVTTLWGVGSERAGLLARLKIFTIEDLLLHRPRRYEDRRNFVRIADLELKQPATVRGKIVAAGIKRWRKGQRSLFECVLDDGTARLHCRWWHAKEWMADYFTVGREFLVFGKPESLRPRTMDHAELELVEGEEDEAIHLNRLAPIYPLTEGIPQRWLRSTVWRTLAQFEAQITEPDPNIFVAASRECAAGLTRSDTARSTRSAALSRGAATLPTRANAIRMLHFPEALEDVEIARRRLALDEFIELQWQIRLRRKKFQTNAQALPSGGDNRLIKPFLAAVGFKITGAQTKVLREIRADLRASHPMRRLLQGDVGSGKTVVAACAALMAIESGYNVALMAPTEILAEQHFANFTKWFGPLDVGVESQTGSRKSTEDRGWKMEDSQRPRSSIPHPPSSIIIGTHALIESGFDIPRLGLVIIDEQHKFGVAQREELVRKGRYPHLLVMTATPIPRTLGLTLYGELDVSVIDELPPGRGQIKTFVRTARALPKVWAFLRERLAEGRQAYVVYPRVEETGPDIKAVTKEFDTLKRALAPFRVGMLHGRLKAREKDEVMSAFRARRLHVLLATSLIEVGVDVPNATVLLVENAERFGLAQLHQLRGRIGRGAHDSYCILVSSASTEESQQRLQVLAETTDGFRIAEADLKLRGPGELLGRQQSGMPAFRFGDLLTDLDLIRQARETVANMG